MASPASTSPAVLDHLLEGCQTLGFDYRYLYLNDAAAAHGRSSKEQLLGRTMMECYPGIEATPMFATLRRCLESRSHLRMENQFTFPDGGIGWFELRFVPVPEGVFILSLDITDRKRAEEKLAHTEEQLRHAQKMEAVGRLAGGVAHDFNNLLSVVLTYSEMLMRRLSQDDPMRDDLAEIRKAGERATELTRQLLAFSRQQVLDPKVLDLNDVIGQTDRMLRRLMGEDIDLETRPGPNLGRIKADPGQLGQILMNLAVNARDAMPDGGKLTVETSNVELDEAYALGHVDLRPGAYVMLAVSDTGSGMDRATQARIFEPFFTTKEQGKGTGLGLSTVFGIVKQSGGNIWVYSEPGRGTTFKIYFPRTGEAPRPSAASESEFATFSGSETILLVEDDEQVRTLARTLLKRFGYRVLEARTPGEALSASERHAETIHLLLTDVVMPEMSGPELARRLTALRPSLKALCMSGYAGEAVLRHGLIDAGLPFLQKPITPETLGRKLREVLAA
ncbi:MAG: hybrid sensor histidine kinase/response regulator [Myxococcales bacterium]